MFALRVRYLTGRVYAATFDEGDAKQTVEWPPHPSRLFSALVASWGEGGAEPDLRAPLEWLEQQTPPAIYYLPCFPRQAVNAYVPVNDSRGLETLPDQRPRKGRTFPSASLLEAEVWFVWPQPLPGALQEAMQTLIRRTPSLGHSASLVSLEMGETVPDGFERLEPGQAAGLRLRVPSAGRLQILERSFALFQGNPSKVHRPSRGATALYAPPERPASPEAPCGLFRDMVILRRSSGERVFLPGTLAVTAALRGALIAHAPQPCPEAISGHASSSTPEQPVRSSRHHVALIPLAFTSSRHATGEISGVAALLPRELTEDEKTIVLQTLARVDELRMPFGTWVVKRTTIEEPHANLQAETWTRPAQTWATITPYVFDRFPGDPYGTEAQETVSLSFDRVGLPRPASVSLMKTSVHFGVPPASAFPAPPARRGKPQRFHIHALVTFDRPVAGPVVAGAGRFYGYGLFRPVTEER
jgi:CRISPR-associated protein Csb2